MPRLLFCLKQREGYWGSYSLSSGLFNSVTFIVDMLNANGIPAKMVQLVDNNVIDAAVRVFKPTHVIVEAYWVVPEKFDILRKLWPHVSWSIRNHSEIPFLSNEGVSMDWTAGYLSRGIEIMSNSPRAVNDLSIIAKAYGNYQSLISYAPNYYPIMPVPQELTPKFGPADDTVRVGCFGAIRPLKNQLLQAVAALKFADFLGRKLEFHINATRIEGHGDQIIKNLRNLFKNSKRATLIEHPWVSHDEFLMILENMDFSMQCSFSETYNIVSADSVARMVAVTASEEVVWLGNYAYADPNDSNSMFQNLVAANSQIRHNSRNNRLIWQWRDLYSYNQKSKTYWLGRFGA